MEASGSTCRGRRKDGSRCPAVVVLASGYCWAHDPALSEQRLAARQAGGAARSTTARIRRLMPPHVTSIYDQLEAALHEVLTGKLPPPQANAAANVARAMIAAYSAGEVEERLRQLQGKLEGLEAPPTGAARTVGR
jgi:hypothetical protein